MDKRPMNILPALIGAVCFASALTARQPPVARIDTAVMLTVVVMRDSVPLSDVTVRSGAVGQPTNARGVALLRLPPGEHSVIASRIGFIAETLTVSPISRRPTRTGVRVEFE